MTFKLRHLSQATNPQLLTTRRISETSFSIGVPPPGLTDRLKMNGWKMKFLFGA